MYAIRSYYETFDSVDRCGIFFGAQVEDADIELACGKQVQTAVNVNLGLLVAPIFRELLFRITSYNVCYTKLLRRNPVLQVKVAHSPPDLMGDIDRNNFV